MEYPLVLAFKLVALAPQIYVRDAAGREILYVKQKLLKLKEKVRVFADSAQTRQLYEINADRVLDFRARYTFTDGQGGVVGAVRRRGARSLWKSSYEVFTADGRAALDLEEENPWVKLADGIIDQIPVVGMFTGYFLNPKYRVVETGSGRAVLRIVKRRSFLESRFEIGREGQGLDPALEVPALLAIVTMVLMERDRG